MHRRITREDIIKANQQIIDNNRLDISKLSPASQSIIRNFHITAEDVNIAFSEAKRKLESI